VANRVFRFRFISVVARRLKITTLKITDEINKIVRCWSKIAAFDLPHHHLAPSLG